jgi:D-arabinose 1-dehydrogenase-like Zn-dependent alcohol dehydrogenase
VIGSFFASDNTCEICRAGYQTSCIHREPVGAEGAQAELLTARSAFSPCWLPTSWAQSGSSR